MNSNKILEGVIFQIGSISITGTIVTTWIVIALLLLLSLIAHWRLQNVPRAYQSVIESIFIAVEDMIESVIPGKVDIVFPFISTLWVFIFFCNLVGLIPSFSSPTADLSVTSALAAIVFLSVHWFGIKTMGLTKYLKHYIAPNPILLPFHLISEFSRTLALAIRLFGNVMSLELAAALVLMVAGFLIPVPLLMLHIIEAIIQAYLFGMLALIYIAGGIQAQEIQLKKKGISYE